LQLQAPGAALALRDGPLASHQGSHCGRAGGYSVFVCSNMAFAGDVTPLLVKHSNSFSLIDCISVGVDHMQRNFEPMRKLVDTWQRRNSPSFCLPKIRSASANTRLRILTEFRMWSVQAGSGSRIRGNSQGAVSGNTRSPAVAAGACPVSPQDSTRTGDRRHRPVPRSPPAPAGSPAIPPTGCHHRWGNPTVRVKKILLQSLRKTSTFFLSLISGVNICKPCGIK